MASDDRDSHSSPIGALFDLGELAPPVDDVCEAGPVATRVLPHDLVEDVVIARSTAPTRLVSATRNRRPVRVVVIGVGLLAVAIGLGVYRSLDTPIRIAPTPDPSPTAVPRPRPEPRAVTKAAPVEATSPRAVFRDARSVRPTETRAVVIDDVLRALHIEEADLRVTPATAVPLERYEHARTPEERTAALTELRGTLGEPDVYATVLDGKLASVAQRLRSLDDSVSRAQLRALESRYFDLRRQRGRTGLVVRASKIAALERDLTNETKR